ncbi:hypothetical protein ABPG73_022906 [Tetrahymena malaccensis]
MYIKTLKNSYILSQLFVVVLAAAGQPYFCEIISGTTFKDCQTSCQVPLINGEEGHTPRQCEWWGTTQPACAVADCGCLTQSSSQISQLNDSLCLSCYTQFANSYGNSCVSSAASCNPAIRGTTKWTDSDCAICFGNPILFASIDGSSCVKSTASCSSAIRGTTIKWTDYDCTVCYGSGVNKFATADGSSCDAIPGASVSCAVTGPPFAIFAPCTDANAHTETDYVCYCNVGYYGTSTDVIVGGSCKKCPIGTTSSEYQQITTIDVCKCLDQNASIQPSNQNPVCYCNSGYYNNAPVNIQSPQCVKQYSCSDPLATAGGGTQSTCYCNKGTYGIPKDAGGPECIVCPYGTSTSSAATSQNIVSISTCNQCQDSHATNNNLSDYPACTCNSGYFGIPATYFGGLGCQQVFNCLDSLATAVGGTASICYCNKGTYGIPKDADASGSGCRGCPIRTTTDSIPKSQDFVLTSACNVCIDQNATNNRSSTTPSCQCSPGYYGIPAIYLGGPGCLKSFSCKDPLAIATGDTAQSCYCNKGTYGVPIDAGGSGCVACPNGTTTKQAALSQDLIQISQCNQCYDQYAINNGSSTSPACKCIPGYSGTPSNQTGILGCTHHFTCADPNAFGFSKETCFCQQGFYGTPIDGNGSGCIQCPNGSSTIGAANTQVNIPISQCFACFDSHAINNRSSSSPACICKLGYQGKPAVNATTTFKCVSTSEYLFPSTLILLIIYFFIQF